MKGGEPTMRKGSYSEELDKDVVERHPAQGDVISPLSHRADSRGGGHQSCSVPQDEANHLRLVSTFMPSKLSELAKSIVVKVSP